MKNTANKPPKVFLDTNILIDYLLFRGDEALASEYLFDSSMNNMIEIHISAHSLTNLYYILRKEYSSEERKFIILNMCAICKVEDASGSKIEKAITGDLAEDVEDALQIQCAIDSNCDYFITRDQELFEKCPIKTLLPHELISELSL